MNTRLLEYFIAVAEHRSFKKAADVCGVSQPALSIQLKKLEEDLGVDLFERTTKSVILTEAGRKTLGSGIQILNDIKELKKKGAVVCGSVQRRTLHRRLSNSGTVTIPQTHS